MRAFGSDMSSDLPGGFAKIVSEGVEGMLAHQRADGAVVYDPAAPIVYPQQAIMPLAFCYAGLGRNPEHKNAPRLLDAIRRLGDFLERFFEADGRVHFDSYGHDVHTV